MTVCTSQLDVSQKRFQYNAGTRTKGLFTWAKVVPGPEGYPIPRVNFYRTFV